MALFKTKSEYQNIEVVSDEFYGAILILDGVGQTTQKDEYFYHEMMVHPALLGSNFQNIHNFSVLIIGGGDGGTLREVLRHEFVKKVVMVELDREVVETAKKYLGINGNYSDERVQLLFQDAFVYASEAKLLDQSFDVVIVDSSDPVGPSSRLYSEEFYTDLHNIITPTGSIVVHVGHPFWNATLINYVTFQMSQLFSSVETVRVGVPSYAGSEFVFAIATKDGHSASYPRVEFTGRYYNPDIHMGAFTTPTFWDPYLHGHQKTQAFQKLRSEQCSADRSPKQVESTSKG
eukprot:CAMPEP_0175125162 /NCGR_PEP_ID=MMETSP0087-20121206/3165_1 /TAXON_ID=136419 /ORGANISM="Unknown Unknown, Strain D1" /LENGTH=289 /DNA_ID=CAMNT_0016406973 /DNA_START=143 /DNA_END=1012 /DNA_ORIENTATION=+